MWHACLFRSCILNLISKRENIFFYSHWHGTAQKQNPGLNVNRTKFPFLGMSRAGNKWSLYLFCIKQIKMNKLLLGTDVDQLFLICNRSTRWIVMYIWRYIRDILYYLTSVTGFEVWPCGRRPAACLQQWPQERPSGSGWAEGSNVPP